MLRTIEEKILDFEGLRRVRELNQNKIIVFCVGCYDIIHSGHAVFFNQCKEYGDILVAGIGKDSSLRKQKGPLRPINPEINRAFLIASMQDVDYAHITDGKERGDKIDFLYTMECLRPDIFVVNSDDSALNKKKDLCEGLGIELETVGRTLPDYLKSTSTTEIINKSNKKYGAPLRIDLAGSFSDIPEVMSGRPGYQSSVAISPLIEADLEGKFNFSGYPRGIGLSTSTAVTLLKMIDRENLDNWSLEKISETLYNNENVDLNFNIGRMDQYTIVNGGFNVRKYTQNSAETYGPNIINRKIRSLENKLVLIYSGISRNAQKVIKQVYENKDTKEGRIALDRLSELGKSFGCELERENYDNLAEIISENWKMQKRIAPDSTNNRLDQIYEFAMNNGAKGGKICGAGGGGAYLFYSEDKQSLTESIKKEFVECFEIDFRFENRNIKTLNNIG